MTQKTLRGVHVLWMVCAFFALVIAVDAFFIFRAVATFPGEQVKNSYVLGLDFNREVERRERQQALGWSVEAGIVEEMGQTLVVRISNSDRQAARGLIVTAKVLSASGKPAETEIALQERSPGEYASALGMPLNGQIRIGMKATRPGETTPAFEAQKTLVMP
jgi:nitrogen fixation protein FixH